MTKNKNKTSPESSERLKKTQNENKPHSTPSHERKEYSREEKDSQKHHI